MSHRYYVYRLIDKKDGQLILQGVLELPNQSDGQTMGHDDARSMVADAAIRKMIHSSARPLHSLIQYCELQGREDERLMGEGEEFSFDWTRCKLAEMELKLGEEE
jgi:hypothetical protein